MCHKRAVMTSTPNQTQTAEMLGNIAVLRPNPEHQRKSVTKYEFLCSVLLYCQPSVQKVLSRECWLNTSVSTSYWPMYASWSLWPRTCSIGHRMTTRLARFINS